MFFYSNFAKLSRSLKCLYFSIDGMGEKKAWDDFSLLFFPPVSQLEYFYFCTSLNFQRWIVILFPLPSLAAFLTSGFTIYC